MHDDETIRGRFIALRLVSSPPFPPLEIRIKGKPLAFNLASFHTTRYNYPALAGAARSLQQRFKSARNRFLISQPCRIVCKPNRFVCPLLEIVAREILPPPPVLSTRRNRRKGGGNSFDPDETTLSKCYSSKKLAATSTPSRFLFTIRYIRRRNVVRRATTPDIPLCSVETATFPTTDTPRGPSR